MPRSFEDIMDHAHALADRFEDVEFEQATDTTTPEMMLRRAAWKRGEAERAVAEAVAAARAAGVTWAAIGELLGTSGQSAQRRYAHVGEDLKDAAVARAKAEQRSASFVVGDRRLA